MTTILNLPDEILRLIFEKVGDRKNLLQIQNACRAWYPTAHIILLKRINLRGGQTERFIEWIESNPNSLYLNAVKSIAKDSFYRREPLNKARIEKLFVRFPNLQEVSTDLYTVLDDKICENILKRCPKLREFQVTTTYSDGAMFREMFYNLRKLVTSLDVGRLEFDGLLNFLSDFHRLQEIKSFIRLGNFQQIVPHVKQWPEMQKISLICENDVDSDYIKIISKEKENYLLEWFSELDYFHLTFKEAFVHTIMYVAKYVNNSTKIGLSCDLNETWTNRRQQLFCNNAFDLFNAAKCGALILRMKFEVLKEYLPEFLQKLSTPATQNVLTIYLMPEVSGFSEMCIEKEQDSSKHIITLSASQGISLQNTATFLLKENVQTVVIDKLALTIYRRDTRYVHGEEANVNAYDHIIKAIPSKEISLNIPLSFRERVSRYNDVYPHVEKLTLRAAPEAKFQHYLTGSLLLFQI